MAEEQKGFWTSMPGILTGLATVVTAITGLYMAVSGDGRNGQGEPFYTYTQDGNWWQVMTRDGKVGYMHVSRIKVVGPR